MRRFAPLLIGLAFTIPAPGQSTTQPAAVAVAASPLTDPDLGKLFRSRIAGIEFNPPVGGSMIRDLNSGEIVRFIYADSNWDVRVKAIPLHTPLPLAAPNNGGVLELMVSQLQASNPASQILRSDVIDVTGKPVGLIEAKYNSGPDNIFAQQAIFRDNDQHYLLLQMSTKINPKPLANVPDALETDARRMFNKMLPTVKILDRGELADEQKLRFYKTRELWVLFDRNHIKAAMQPLRLMRIVRDGKDIGFIQVNERLATHNGNEGMEIIVRSRVQTELSLPGPAKAANAAALPASGMVVPELSIGPKSNSPAVIPSAGSSGPSNTFTNSTFFVTFDRDHEDWTSITQIDDQTATQLVESANTDMTRHIDAMKVREAEHAKVKPGDPPPVVTVADYVLNIQYAHGRRQDKPANIQLPPDYLPQGIAQLLPRLLPSDPAKYMFSFYVTGEQQLMRRYVDVEQSREVELDGKTYRAVPISDRIGVDGIPTVHYVSRQGEWLGSVNEAQKLTVLPSDESTLTEIWGKQPLGFKVADLPPPQEDSPEGPRKVRPSDKTGSVNLQGPVPNGR